MRITESTKHITRQLVGAYVPDLVREHLRTTRDFRRFYNTLSAQVRGMERAKGMKEADGFYFHTAEELLKKAMALGADFRKTFESSHPSRF